MAAHHRANKKTMETVYRVYRLPEDLRKRVRAKREKHNVTLQAVIEAAGAEQAARMAAMTTASDNAEELGTDLTRLRNRMRQAEITTGLLEVVSGANAQSAG